MKVKTTEPVQHDGKNVEVGTVIEVTKAAGEQLIEAKAAEPVGKQLMEAKSAAPIGKQAIEAKAAEPVVEASAVDGQAVGQ